jgi:acetyl esterase/lipase/GNAT superfamily N-acetyltransferase
MLMTRCLEIEALILVLLTVLYLRVMIMMLDGKSWLRLRMKSLIFALCVVFAFGDLRAQTNVWQQSPGHTQIPIWPGAAPDAEPVPGREFVETTKELFAGKPAAVVNNVSQPTMTVYSPKRRNTGVAVVVFPDGGYNCLAIDLEGTEICDWLTSKGITGVLLKYRVPTLRFEEYRESRQVLQDAQRKLGLVRFRAAQWHINPHKIGVIGFSAGGHIVAAMSTRFDKRLYPMVDEADKESCRPDFAIAVHPGHLSKHDGNLELNPNIPVTSNKPPKFLLQAEDDPVDPVENSLVYLMALKKAGVPVEMHLYAEGKHAFGLPRTMFPITEWPELVEKWLQTIWITSEDPEVRRLLEALSSDEWREREQAAEAFGSMGLSARSAIGHLIERLADEQWHVRKAAAPALSRMGPVAEQAIPSLIAALADEEWHVRKPAAKALAAIRPASEPAVSHLIEVLEDKECQVRKPAALALGAIGPAAKAAVPALRDCLNDPDLFLVATVGDAVVGTVMGGYDGHRGWTYSLAVDQAYRRRGVATALVRRLEELLREIGFLKVNLQVRGSNSDILGSYEHIGYSIEERVSLGKRLYCEEGQA